MKIRRSFVSNSSSMSFILDARNPEVQKILPKIKSLNKADGLNRRTCSAVGEHAVQYAKNWITEYDECCYDDGDINLGKWILKWADELGKANVVFVRESDEEMGGSLCEVGLSYLDIDKLAVDSMEYH